VGVQLILVTHAIHDVDALRALREVGRHGSIASAATAMGISQQALSARMRTLEKALEVPLLVRTPGGSRLTEQSTLVLGWAEDLLDAADRLEAGVRSIRRGSRTGSRSRPARPPPSTWCRTG
jgi:molybdate transport repressor ModE-like protein